MSPDSGADATVGVPVPFADLENPQSLKLYAAQKQAAKRALVRAGNNASVSISESEGGMVRVEVTRPRFDGTQTVTKAIDSSGNTTKCRPHTIHRERWCILIQNPSSDLPSLTREQLEALRRFACFDAGVEDVRQALSGVFEIDLEPEARTLRVILKCQSQVCS